MEDDFKYLKVYFLSNLWLDLIQILNLSSGDQTNTDKGFNWKQPQWKITYMEDNRKNLKVNFLSTHWLDLIQIVNLSSGNQK